MNNLHRNPIQRAAQLGGNDPFNVAQRLVETAGYIMPVVRQAEAEGRRGLARRLARIHELITK